MEHPAWRITHNVEFDAWEVAIHGHKIMDAETGEPALFRPPYEISSETEYRLWAENLKKTVERMSGKKVILD